MQRILVNFITKFGLKVRNILIKEVTFEATSCKNNLSETPSTSNFDPYQARPITGESDAWSMSSEDTNYTETNSLPTTPQKDR